MIATILAFLAPVGRFLKPYAGYLLIAALLGLALWWSNHAGYRSGVKAKEAEYAKALERAEKRAAETTKASDAITAKAKGELALSLAKIDELSNQLRKETKTYVSPKADRACVIPAGYVLLRNAAGTGSTPVPPSPGQSLDADSGVALSALAQNDVENGRSFQTAITEIEAWRGWYQRQAELWEKNYGAQR
jgi:hypothetical protein